MRAADLQASRRFLAEPLATSARRRFQGQLQALRMRQRMRGIQAKPRGRLSNRRLWRGAERQELRAWFGPVTARCLHSSRCSSRCSNTDSSFQRVHSMLSQGQFRVRVRGIRKIWRMATTRRHRALRVLLPMLLCRITQAPVTQ
ncbi:hypothetical protein GGF45_003530 [Coemansia sp. RSA 551]|nr:hypothetical protein GGF45_003530 [Coemansia sp. RSA 551]